MNSFLKCLKKHHVFESLYISANFQFFFTRELSFSVLFLSTFTKKIEIVQKIFLTRRILEKNAKKFEKCHVELGVESLINNFQNPDYLFSFQNYFKFKLPLGSCFYLFSIPRYLMLNNFSQFSRLCDGAAQLKYEEIMTQISKEPILRSCGCFERPRSTGSWWKGFSLRTASLGGSSSQLPPTSADIGRLVWSP